MYIYDRASNNNVSNHRMRMASSIARLGLHGWLFMSDELKEQVEAWRSV